MDFMIDVELLDTSPGAVILSAAILVVDFSKEFTYQDLINQSCYIKFNAKKQVPQRIIGADTLAWWKKQDPEVQRTQLMPSPVDLDLETGYDQLCNFIRMHTLQKRNVIIWARGVLDGLVLEHIGKQLNKPLPFNYSRLRDVRTAVDLLSGSNTGYCDVDPPMPANLRKHHPVDDCIMDVWQLRYYKEVGGG